MFAWIMENMATMILSAVLTAAVVAVIAGLIRGRKKGTSSCGCASCPSGCCSISNTCHSKEK